MKLYEIANAYTDLCRAIEDGEIPDEAIADTLEAIGGELEEKADNICCVLKSIDAEVKAIKEEEQKLAERRKSKEKSYDRLKQYLSDTLVSTNCKRIETARNVITFRKSEQLNINEDAFIEWATANHSDLVTFSQVAKFDKTMIKNALKSGSAMPGAYIVEKQNIQIK